MRKPIALSIGRVYRPLPPQRRPAAVRMGCVACLIPCHGPYLVRLPLFLPTSDSIFLLSGVVEVVLFCTIRRVIPVKEVAKEFFTGQIFRTQEESPGDTAWCIGSLETGEKCISDDKLSLPVNDDYSALRQPKFEIVTARAPQRNGDADGPTADTATISYGLQGGPSPVTIPEDDQVGPEETVTTHRVSNPQRGR